VIRGYRSLDVQRRLYMSGVGGNPTPAERGTAILEQAAAFFRARRDEVEWGDIVLMLDTDRCPADIVVLEPGAIYVGIETFIAIKAQSEEGVR
jgi:hypothetical protein